MSVEHTPTTDDVRAYYVWSQSRRVSRERGAEFDRWLTEHNTQAAAEALQAAIAENTRLREENLKLRRGR